MLKAIGGIALGAAALLAAGCGGGGGDSTGASQRNVASTAAGCRADRCIPVPEPGDLRRDRRRDPESQQPWSVDRRTAGATRLTAVAGCGHGVQRLASARHELRAAAGRSRRRLVPQFGARRGSAAAASGVGAVADPGDVAPVAASRIRSAWRTTTTCSCATPSAISGS